ncbi:hypothetical protein CPB84DRAFT_1672272, partial [Gymnopilus junonius]
DTELIASCDHDSQIVHRYELERNTAHAELKALCHKFVDITNEEEGDRPCQLNHPRICHCLSSSSNEDELSLWAIGSQANDTFVYQAGHKFFLVYSAWIRLEGGLFDVEVDKAYNAAERFENDKNKAQGQLQEVWSLLQTRFERQILQQNWVRRMMLTFMKEIKTERYNMASCIRNHCAAILQVSEVDPLSAEAQKAKFRHRIGWVESAHGGSYSTVDVEILHKDYGGEYSLSSVFLNPVRMGMSILYREDNIARWALSSDDTLQAVGTSTGIHYFEDYEEYLKILETGLRRKKKSTIKIIKEWDSRIFANSDSSLVGKKAKSNADDGGVKRAMDLLEADSEEDEEPVNEAVVNGDV